MFTTSKKTVRRKNGKTLKQLQDDRHAFTLAEVLITLGIIGVVAAMTMPTLIAKYQKKQTVTQLKKAYAELNKAVSYSEIENGDCKYWDYNLNSLDFYNKYLSKYLQNTTGVNIMV